MSFLHRRSRQQESTTSNTALVPSQREHENHGRRTLATPDDTSDWKSVSGMGYHWMQGDVHIEPGTPNHELLQRSVQQVLATPLDDQYPRGTLEALSQNVEALDQAGIKTVVITTDDGAQHVVNGLKNLAYELAEPLSSPINPEKDLIAMQQAVQRVRRKFGFRK